ncbi:methyltransferase-like 26 isoform X2 [Mercenaria mercenaria]|nr:methyltransferase-like 26 isoform X2 [Mercenaria mercenaria]
MQQAAAADRNKEAILEVLRKYLSADFNGYFLEIASGTGQHVTHFAEHFKQATFQPSDFDPLHLNSITAYISHHKLSNVKPPSKIDITVPVTSWPGMINAATCDVIYNANMVHISPWETAVGLFDAAGALLKPDGLLITYGPYAEDGVLEPDSNVRFDQSLKARDPSWGIRDIKDLKVLADKNRIQLIEKIAMPANNKTLIWKKSS